MTLFQRFLATGVTMSLALIYAGVLAEVLNPHRPMSIVSVLGLACMAIAGLAMTLRHIWRLE